MENKDYYSCVIEKIKNVFTDFDYVVAAGKELLSIGWNPNGILVAVEPKSSLKKFCELGLQLHMPVIGKNCETVLMPLDFEISLTTENYKLYETKKAQNFYFKKMVTPLLKFLKNIFIENKISFLMDLTPSGGHILLTVKKGTDSWNALKSIGFLEPDLKSAYSYRDENDLKRKNGITEEAGLVFSGISRISEYIGVKAYQALNGKTEYPLSFCDALPASLNYDISWASDAAYMRSIRTPFSLHKKNIEKYQNVEQSSLVDVIKTEFDAETGVLKDFDLDLLLDYMWDLEGAVKHSENFTGKIPEDKKGLKKIIDEYKKSNLFKHHQKFDLSESEPKGLMKKIVNKDNKLNEHSKRMLQNPEPAMLEPMQIQKLAYDMIINNNYTSKQLGCLIRDYYQDSNYKWYGIDWYKNPSETRAFYWARLYGAVVKLEEGLL